MGGSILAVFGFLEENESDVEDPIASAVEMQMAMNELSDINRSLNIPDLFIGIATNTGSVCCWQARFGTLPRVYDYRRRGESHFAHPGTLHWGSDLSEQKSHKFSRGFITTGSPNRVEVKGARDAVDPSEVY